MRDVRVYHREPVTDGSEFELSAGAARHVGRVLRMTAGAEVVVFDGSGREWRTVLLDPGRGRVRAGTAHRVDRESPLDLILVQGIARGEKMDWAIQKAVELGVSGIIPVTTARTTVRLDPERAKRRREHWQAVAIAACEQSGRTRIPGIAPPSTFAGWLAEKDGPAVVLDPRAQRTLTNAWQVPPRQLHVVVGPEGGLDEYELDLAAQAGCIAVQMGPRVLRAETAGITALAALQVLYGDLSVRS